MNLACVILKFSDSSYILQQNSSMRWRSSLICCVINCCSKFVEGDEIDAEEESVMFWVWSEDDLVADDLSRSPSLIWGDLLWTSFSSVRVVVVALDSEFLLLTVCVTVCWPNWVSIDCGFLGVSESGVTVIVWESEGWWGFVSEIVFCFRLVGDVDKIAFDGDEDCEGNGERGEDTDVFCGGDSLWVVVFFSVWGEVAVGRILCSVSGFVLLFDPFEVLWDWHDKFREGSIEVGGDEDSANDGGSGDEGADDISGGERMKPGSCGGDVPTVSTSFSISFCSVVWAVVLEGGFVCILTFKVEGEWEEAKGERDGGTEIDWDLADKVEDRGIFEAET